MLGVTHDRVKRLVAVETWFAGQPEDLLTDGVALHLVGAPRYRVDLAVGERERGGSADTVSLRRFPGHQVTACEVDAEVRTLRIEGPVCQRPVRRVAGIGTRDLRSEEHTSELQSLTNLVCRLL